MVHKKLDAYLILYNRNKIDAAISRTLTAELCSGRFLTGKSLHACAAPEIAEVDGLHPKSSPQYQKLTVYNRT